MAEENIHQESGDSQRCEERCPAPDRFRCTKEKEHKGPHECLDGHQWPYPAGHPDYDPDYEGR